MPELVSTLQNGVQMKAGHTRWQILSMKAALWALGHIGSTDDGSKYLASIGAHAAVVNVAESCSVLSIRG